MRCMKQSIGLEVQQKRLSRKRIQITYVCIHILVLQKQDLLIFLGRFVSLHADDEALEIIKNLHIDNIDDLSNQEIINYAKLLKGHLISSLLVLDNSHYNKMIDSGINQANIRARLFNQSVVNVLQKVKKSVEFKVIDQFVSPKTYYNYLKSEVIVVKDMIFETNADEQYLAVLAAEIISRYAYLQYFASMTKSLKMNLARGAGTNAEIVAVKLAHKYGDKILTKVCKLNFTNMKRVKGALKKLKEGLQAFFFIQRIIIDSLFLFLLQMQELYYKKHQLHLTYVQLLYHFLFLYIFHLHRQFL